VHYLNVPYPDDNKLAAISPCVALWGDKKEWTKEELVSQLKPMCESASVSTAAAGAAAAGRHLPFSASGVFMLSLSYTRYIPCASLSGAWERLPSPPAWLNSL